MSGVTRMAIAILSGNAVVISPRHRPLGDRRSHLFLESPRSLAGT